MSGSPAIGVTRVDADEPIAPGGIGPETRCVVVTQGGTAVGELLVEGREAATQDLRGVISRRLGDELWRRRVAADIRRLAGIGSESHLVANVSVVIDGTASGGDIRRCVDSVLGAEVTPHAVVVVGQDDRALRELYPGLDERVRGSVDPLAGLHEPDALVAILDAACTVDPGWLGVVGDTFADPLVLASVGYVGPAEISTPVQYALRLGESAPAERVVDSFGSAIGHVLGHRATGSIYRAPVLQRATASRSDSARVLFDPGFHGDLRARILERGCRVALNPSSIVWQLDPADVDTARRASFALAASRGRASSELVRSDARWAGLALLRDELRRQFKTLTGVPRLRSWSPASVALAGLWGLVTGAVRGVTRGRKSASGVDVPEGVGSHGHRNALANVRAEAPALSVAIASYNRRDSLADVLAALARQSYPRERFEVVVVLDGSTDGSDAAVSSFESQLDIRVVWQENRGLAAARNRGAREARSPILVFLDDDTVPEPDFLAVHGEGHRDAAGDHVALGYCPPVITDTGLWALTYRQWWEDYYRRKGEPGHRWTYLDFSDGNSSMGRSVLEAAGWYDEEFGGRRQDWELGARLLMRGVRFRHYHAAVARHHLDASFDSARRRSRGEARADLMLASKHPDLIPSLPFAGAVRAAPYRLSRSAGLAYRLPRATRAAARAARTTLEMLEGLDLRRAWHRVSRALLWEAYLAGLREEVDSLPALRDLLSPVLRGEGAGLVQVWLDDPNPARLPALPATVELEAGYSGTLLARAPIWFPGEQWDWAVVAARVAEGVRPPTSELPPPARPRG